MKFFPPGYLTIVYGKYGTGKSTLSLQAFRELKKNNIVPKAFIINSKQELTSQRICEVLDIPETNLIGNYVKFFKINSFTWGH